jgi:hypothetical protein
MAQKSDKRIGGSAILPLTQYVLRQVEQPLREARSDAVQPAA